MMFPKELRDIILDYAAEYELLDWLDGDCISWGNLVRNRNAVDYMIKNPEWTRWGHLSRNSNHAAFYHMRAHMPSLLNADDLADSSCPDAVAYACEHIRDMRDSRQLSQNPLAIPWLEKNREWVDSEVILANPAAKDLLSSMGLLDKIPRWADEKSNRYDFSDGANRRQAERECDMMYLCENPSTWAMEIVDRNIHHVWSTRELMRNPYANDILPKCKDLVDYLGRPIMDESYIKPEDQKSDVQLAIENPESINWHVLSVDPDAIEFLKDNMDKVTKDFSRNPAIFELRRPAGVFELL